MKLTDAFLHRIKQVFVFSLEDYTAPNSINQLQLPGSSVWLLPFWTTASFYTHSKKSPFFIGMLVDHHHELSRSTLSKAKVAFSYLLALKQPAVATETGKETTSPRASLQGGLTVFQPRPYLWKQLLLQLYWREKILLIPAMDCPLSASVPVTTLASVCCLQVNNKRISDTYEGILHIGICVTFLLQR